MSDPETAVPKTQEEGCILTEVTRSNEDTPIVQSKDAVLIPEESMQPKTENQNAFTKLQTTQTDNPPTENGNAERPATIGGNATDIELATQNARTLPHTLPETVTVNEASTENVTQSPSKSEITSPQGSIEKIAGRESAVKPLSDIARVSSMAAGDSCATQKSNEKNAESKSETREATDVDVTQNNAQINKPLVTNGSKASNEELLIEKLKQALKKTMEERDSHKEKLDSMGKKLVILQESYDAIAKGDEDTLRRTVDQLRGKLIQTSLQLEDRNRLVTNQEKQINALNSQVASLKEVESLTRSLLQIRNMEVKHLQAEVDDMEVRISEERDRYNSMINKMDAAVRLNSDLKKEYETQLGLFRDLREKYEEKVTLLSEEKRALENAAQSK